MTSGQPPGSVHPGEDVAQEFEAAWSVFGQTCGAFVAPEAGYQAWFAEECEAVT